MINAINASLTYPDGTQALKPFDLSLSNNDILYVTGPSGSGKTSLFKLIMGMEFTTTGQLEVLGQPMKSSNLSDIINLRQYIGPVFQQFRLIKGRTALENVMSGLRFLDFKGNIMKSMAMDALARSGLEDKAMKKVESLSWGECQRVAVARAIARKPSLLIADEPTGNLDHDNAVAIIDLLASFASKDTSVVIITHATHLLENGYKGLFVSMNSGLLKTERKV